MVYVFNNAEVTISTSSGGRVSANSKYARTRIFEETTFESKSSIFCLIRGGSREKQFNTIVVLDLRWNKLFSKLEKKRPYLSGTF